MRVMLRLHHVNLSIPVDGADAEAAFLIDFLHYERMELTPDTPPQAKWFEGEDGTQIHLSEDPEHHPSSRAHVAVDLGDSLSELRAKFRQIGLRIQDVRRWRRHDALLSGSGWKSMGVARQPRRLIPAYNTSPIQAGSRTAFPAPSTHPCTVTAVARTSSSTMSRYAS